MWRVRYTKLARGQASSVIPPTIPMCRKGPVACGGKAGCQLAPAWVLSPKSTCSNARDLLLQPALLEEQQCQRVKNRLLGRPNRLPALVRPPLITRNAAAPGRTARAAGAPCLAMQE